MKKSIFVLFAIFALSAVAFGQETSAQNIDLPLLVHTDFWSFNQYKRADSDEEIPNRQLGRLFSENQKIDSYYTNYKIFRGIAIASVSILAGGLVAKTAFTDKDNETLQIGLNIFCKSCSMDREL